MLRDGTCAYLWTDDARYRPNPLRAGRGSGAAGPAGRGAARRTFSRGGQLPGAATCRWRLACCAAWRHRRSPFGRLVLVSGPEALFADRAVEALLQQMRSEAPDVEVSEIEAARLDSGKLAEITSPSLFSSQRAAVITELENLAPRSSMSIW